MTDEQKCIADLVSLVMDISDKAMKRDLSLIRPTSGIGGGIRLGQPPICKISDELFDKHGDVIHDALRAKEAGEENYKKLGAVMSDERVTIVDARKLLQIMNDCCKGLVFTKDEVRQIATICLKAIE